MRIQNIWQKNVNFLKKIISSFKYEKSSCNYQKSKRPLEKRKKMITILKTPFLKFLIENSQNDFLVKIKKTLKKTVLEISMENNIKYL